MSARKQHILKLGNLTNYYVSLLKKWILDERLILARSFSQAAKNFSKNFMNNSGISGILVIFQEFQKCRKLKFQEYQEFQEFVTVSKSTPDNEINSNK
jgi:hypothetical protein